MKNIVCFIYNDYSVDSSSITSLGRVKCITAEDKSKILIGK